MTKVIRAEIYKLFHSFYLWGIGLGYLLVTTILVHDHIDEMSYLRSGMYPIPFMLFFIIALAIVMIGNEFDQRQLQGYIAAGHKRIEVFAGKLTVYLSGSVGIMLVTLLIDGLAGLLIRGETIDFGTILFLIPSFIAIAVVPAFFAFVFKDIGKTLGSGLISFVLMLLSLNTAGISDKAVYLPYGHSLLGYSETLPADKTGLLLLDLVWIAVFVIGSYIAVRRSDLK
jgi:ABC-type transport system involved in multi-copper enzyme maturation permease subunit